MILTETAWDRTAALTAVEGDEGLLSEMAELFLDSMGELMQRVHSAVHDAKAQDLQRAAHTLKGAAANFSAAKTVAAAFHLECLGRERNLTEAPAAYQVLAREIEEFRIELAEFASEAHP